MSKNNDDEVAARRRLTTAQDKSFPQSNQKKTTHTAELILRRHDTQSSIRSINLNNSFHRRPHCVVAASSNKFFSDHSV